MTQLADNTVNTGGGDVHGGIFLAGGNMVVNPPLDTPPVATYEAVPMWRSPLTLAVLSWIGLVLALLGIFPIWKLVDAVLDLIVRGHTLSAQGATQHWWGVAFGLLVVVFAVVIELRRVAKYELRKPLFLGWALSGAKRRITFEKIRVGDCPKCGGKMRYYNKAKAWVPYVDANGNVRRKVVERVPALECRRNPQHCCEVDPTEV